MKTYVKPELYYENFELSEHIASCATPTKFGEQDVCWIPDELKAFLTPATSTDVCQSYCEEVSGSEFGLFTS